MPLQKDLGRSLRFRLIPHFIGAVWYPEKKRGVTAMGASLASIVFSIIVLGCAVTMMAILLDLRPWALSIPGRVVFLVGMAAIVAGNLYALGHLGIENAGRYYTLTTQLPVFLLFLLLSRRHAIAILFATLTAIFLSFPLTLGRTVLVQVFHAPFLMTVVLVLAICVLQSVFVMRFLRPNFLYMLEHVKQERMLRFCIVPLLYNIISYLIGRYNYSSAMSAGTQQIRILLFLMMLAVYFLLLDIFKSTREKAMAEQEQELLFLQLKASRQRMEELKHAQDQARYYRHDMRHHLALIGGWLADGELDRLRKYMQEVQQDIDAITPLRYCQNETVDLILSSFTADADRRGVHLDVEMSLPDQLPIGDTQLCALLSNAVENAIAAAGSVEDPRARVVHVDGCIRSGKLLLCIENPYAGQVVMEDGLPKSHREGHGFGVKSMVSIVEKHGGFYTFVAKDGIFTAKIVL